MKICLFHIVSWNLQVQHTLSDKYYMNYSHVMCFTEKHASDTSFQRIEENHPDWKSIHHPSAQHGLAVCYSTKKVVIKK